MYWDEKKQLTSIISKRSPKGDLESAAPMKAESVKDEHGIPDGRHEAAQDLMAAVHEKSPEKMMRALMNFIDMHKHMSSDD